MPVAAMLSLIMPNEVVQSYVSRFNVIASFTLLSPQTLTFPKLLYGIKQIKHYFCHFQFFSKTLTGIQWYKKLQSYSAN